MRLQLFSKIGAISRFNNCITYKTRVHHSLTILAAKQNSVSTNSHHGNSFFKSKTKQLLSDINCYFDCNLLNNVIMTFVKVFWALVKVQSLHRFQVHSFLVFFYSNFGSFCKIKHLKCSKNNVLPLPRKKIYFSFIFSVA